MLFKIVLQSTNGLQKLPINYQYPLSAALYKIIAKGDAQYAAFLHENGYGKRLKLFTFSDISCPFKIERDRLLLQSEEVGFWISFYLPQATETFIKGLFLSEQVEIADKRTQAVFTVRSVESIPDTLQQYKENEIINIVAEPLSPIVCGIQNEKRNYIFLNPDDPRFRESTVYNWRSKIVACFDEATALSALLMVEVVPIKKPFKSRLITIKGGTPAETKIRGWMNFELAITAEKRFLELLLGAGVGINNAMGMGCVRARIDKP